MARKTTKIALVLGTRPEIIKLAPIIRLLKKRAVPHFMLHTGQHYSYEMDRVFFHDLGLAEPKYQLAVRSKANRHGDHVGRMMEVIEEILMEESPRAVLVQGDTNTVLAGSLAAAKIAGVKLGHVEAGLRSYDRGMPEEINRVASDHVSDFLFAPTLKAKKILLGEGVLPERIHVTGNTIVDAVIQNAYAAKKKHKIASGEYFLMTLHRQENVDRKSILRSILKGIGRAARELRRPVLFFIHPRTAYKLAHFKLEVPEGLRLMRPVGFLEFLAFQQSARLALTDSGGLQEEACILGVPCVTLRTTTERPETVEAGANVIAGHDPERIFESARRMVQKKGGWKNPFGDGRASERILAVLERKIP